MCAIEKMGEFVRFTNGEDPEPEGAGPEGP